MGCWWASPCRAANELIFTLHDDSCCYEAASAWPILIMHWSAAVDCWGGCMMRSSCPTQSATTWLCRAAPSLLVVSRRMLLDFTQKSLLWANLPARGWPPLVVAACEARPLLDVAAPRSSKVGCEKRWLRGGRPMGGACAREGASARDGCLTARASCPWRVCGREGILPAEATRLRAPA
ncbi:hypothetical protein Dimus_011451 [Dionaea muscipula]